MRQESHLMLLVIAAFLRALRDLCVRHFRRNFVRNQENLVGRMRGIPLISSHLRENVSRGRLDRAYCKYQSISHDCRENQILFAALVQCIRYLLRQPDIVGTEALWHWSSFCRTTLNGVSLQRVTSDFFNGLRYSGTFVHYRKPHVLAKMILRSLGSDPRGEMSVETSEIPPFAICTYELFERYTEVLLRGRYGDALWAGYKDRNLGPYDLHGNKARDNGYVIRPDFLLKTGDGKYILDCKYKSMAKAIQGREL